MAMTRAAATCFCIVMMFLGGDLLGGAQEHWKMVDTEGVFGTDSFVLDFAVGADGVPWIIPSDTPGGVYSYSNGKWQKLPGGFISEEYLTRLYKAPSGDVYLSHRGRNTDRSVPGHTGSVYLLKNSKAEHVTDYYYERDVDRPNLHFDKEGRIWNWGNMFVARYENGRWERVEASLGPCSVLEDSKANVYFIGKGKMACYRDGSFKTDIELPKIPLPIVTADWVATLPPSALRMRCSLLGDDKIAFVCHGFFGVAILDLNTLRFDLSLSKKEVFANNPCCDVLRDPNNDVWVLMPHDKHAAQHYYTAISANGMAVRELHETAVKWDNGRIITCPESVLFAKDGATYFGSPDNGVHVLRDGVLSHVDWKQGVPISRVDWIQEGRNGAIWCASRRSGIAVYDPAGSLGQQPDNKQAETWQEHPLASTATMQDMRGYIWCFLSDKPQTISRWDGRKWVHCKTGADSGKVVAMMADDLDRIHLRMYDYPSGVYRIADTKVDRFQDMKEMLADSVLTGSRQFVSSSPERIICPVVTQDKEIWYGQHHYGRFSYFNGERWFDCNVSGRLLDIAMHTSRSVAVVTDKGLFTLDRGQVVKLGEEPLRDRQVFGEGGQQLFYKGVYEANKSRFYLMHKTRNRTYLSRDISAFVGFDAANVPESVIQMPTSLGRIWLTEGGFWAQNSGRPKLLRHFNGLTIEVDLDRTPVSQSFGAQESNIYDDQNGSIWIQTRDKLYRSRLGRIDTRIDTDVEAVYRSRRLKMVYEGTVGGEAYDMLRYCWRLDGGAWSEPSARKHAELAFAESGEHTFEVVAIGDMGNIDPSPARLSINVVIPYPEVRIVSAPGEMADGSEVVIRYEVVQRDPGSPITFQWRLDGGDWSDSVEAEARFKFLDDGRHVFEVRAIEAERHVQPVPARVEFVTRTEHEAIAMRHIERLKSRTYTDRDAAATALVSMGEKVLPYLKDEFERAEGDAQWWLRSVIWQIEHQPKRTDQD